MKKIIHILIICSFLFCLIQNPIVNAAADQGEEYTLLKDLRIVRENADFNEQFSVEDLARMSVILHSFGKADDSIDYLQSAKDYGLIDEGTRAPISADTVTLTLVKSVYRKFCADKTDQEIIELGSNHGIYKSVHIVDSSDLTLGEAAALARNVLDMKSLKDDGRSYSFDTKTILKRDFEIDEQDGVLYTGKMRGLKDGFVSINNEVYETDKDYSEFGGYMVRSYVKDDQLISVDTHKFKNEIYIISANDIDSVASDSITFYKTRSNTQKLNLDSNAKELYNGRLVDFNYNDMDISNGYVKLIKHPSDLKYSVVVISQYDIMVAGGTGNNVIYGLEGSGINVRIEPDDIETTIMLDGEKVELSEIKKNDVLTLSYTKDREELDIEIVRNTVTGVLEQWGTDTIKIGRKTYVKTAYFKQFAERPELGSEIVLLLDKSGLAVDIEHVGDSKNYAYFMGMYYDEDSEKSFIRIFDRDGKSRNVALKSKVTLNGKSVNVDETDDNEVANAFKTLIECDTEGNKTSRRVNDYVYQLIMYKTDSNGEVNFIDTAIEGPNEDKDEQLKLEVYINKNIKYKSGAAQFIDSFGITGDGTAMFRVPSTDNVFDDNGNLDKEKRALANKDKHYEVASPGYIKNDSKVIISGYSISKGGLAKAAVLYNEDLSTDAEFRDTSTPLFVVTKITQGIDADEDMCYILDGFEKNAKKRYFIKEEDWGRKEGKSEEKVYPQVHDIMQIKADSDGVALNYTTRYSRKDNKSYYERTYDEAEFGCISGYVTNKDENGFKLMSDLGNKTKERIAMNKGINNYYVYDVTEKTMRSGSIFDLVAEADSPYHPSQIFCTSSYGEVRQVIIYANEEE